MLTAEVLDSILARIPSLRIAVVGDLFLDRYLDIDPALTEPSLETGLDAYQVVRVRPSPGAAGTVVNNLAALGVGTIWPVAVIGDDGEGYELRGALRALPGVNDDGVVVDRSRRTPTYTKPLLQRGNLPPQELNRLDIKNRAPLSRQSEDIVLRLLDDLFPKADALVVLDQVSEANCGVISDRVREHLQALGEHAPGKPLLADSRARIGLFRSVWLKPNRGECLRAAGLSNLDAGVEMLARRCGRPVFCTCGEQGILVVDPRRQPAQPFVVPAYAVRGPIDPVGAGDSISAALACALAAEASLPAAAAFANLVASITITQLGTTGTASPEQLRKRFQRLP